MKNFILHISLLLVIPLISGTKQSYAQSVKPFLTGSITNYSSQPLYLYQCYGDTLLLADSTRTDKSGEFVFLPSPNGEGLGVRLGLLKVVLQSNQWFYIINDGKPIELKTVYRPDMFNNWATDSMQIIKSDENKWFYN